MDQSRGDHDGRRLARARSIALSEAGRVAQLLESLLRRADHEVPEMEALAKQITEAEQSELLRAHGHIESRRRFKLNAGQPLHESRPTNLLFLDESGQSRPRGDQPIFAVGAAALSEDALADYVERADKLKMDFFGTTDVNLHEPDMRFHKWQFWLRGDTRRQRSLCDAVDELIAATDFKAFGVAVRQDAFGKFLDETPDPYLPTDAYALAIHLLMERYVDFLASEPDTSPLGRVTFESQGPLEDAHHQHDYADLLIGGTRWIPGRAFRNFLETGIRFVPKGGSNPVELADIVSRELFEWVRSDCTAEPQRWRVLDEKFYARDDMLMGKFGVKVFPDSDIRELVEAHRERCKGQQN